MLIWYKLFTPSLKRNYESFIWGGYCYHLNLPVKSFIVLYFCIFPFVLRSFLLHNMEQPDMFTVDTSPKLLVEWEI